MSEYWSRERKFDRSNKSTSTNTTTAETTVAPIAKPSTIDYSQYQSKPSLMPSAPQYMSVPGTTQTIGTTTYVNKPLPPSSSGSSGGGTSSVPQLEPVPAQPPMNVIGGTPGAVTEVKTGTVIMPGQSTQKTSYTRGDISYDQTYQALATQYAAQGLGDPRGMSNTQLAQALNRNINVSNVLSYREEKNRQAALRGEELPYSNLPVQPTAGQAMSVLRPISYQEYAARGPPPEGYVWGYPSQEQVIAQTKTQEDWSWAMSKTPEQRTNELFAAEGAGFIMPTGASKGSVLINQFSFGLFGTPEYRTPTQNEIVSGAAIPASVVSARERFASSKWEEQNPVVKLATKFKKKSEEVSNVLFEKQPDVITKTFGKILVRAPAETIATTVNIGTYIGKSIKYGPITTFRATPTNAMGDVAFGGLILATEGMTKFVSPFLRQIIPGVKTEMELAGMALKSRQAGKGVIGTIKETKYTPEIIFTGLKGTTKTQKAIGAIGSGFGGAFLGAAIGSAAYSENPSEAFVELGTKATAFTIIDIGAARGFTAAKERIIAPRAYGEPIIRFAQAEKKLLKTTPKGEQAVGEIVIGTQQRMRNLLGQEYIAETIAKGPTAQLAGRGAMEASALTTLSEVKTIYKNMKPSEYFKYLEDKGDILIKKGIKVKIGEEKGKTLIEMPGRISSVFQIANINEAFAESVGGQTPYEYFDVYGMAKTSQRLPSSKVQFTSKDLFSEVSITKETKKGSIITSKGTRELEWARGTALAELSKGITTTTTKKPKGSLLTLQERWQDLSKQKRPKATSWLAGQFVSETRRDILTGKGARKSIWDIKVIEYPKESRTNKAIKTTKRLIAMPIGKKGQLSLVPQFGLEKGTETGFEILAKEEPKAITKEVSISQKKALEETQRGTLIQVAKEMNLGVSKGRLKLLGELKSAPRIFTGATSRTVTKGYLDIMGKEIVKPTTKPMTETIIETGLLTRQATKQATKTKPSQATGFEPPPVPPPEIPFTFPGFMLSPGGDRLPSFYEQRRVSRKMAYTPNVLGLISGKTISAKQVRKGQVFTGFELRAPVRGAMGGMLWMR